MALEGMLFQIVLFKEGDIASRMCIYGVSVCKIHVVGFRALSFGELIFCWKQVFFFFFFSNLECI